MITIRNTLYNQQNEQARCEELVNSTLNKRNSVMIPINCSAYHNNDVHTFERTLALKVARECIKVGFFCYYCKPSWKYDQWMDIYISKYPESETENYQRIY